MAELFSAEFIAALQHLRISPRQVAPGGRHAEHRSGDLGGGLEFRDFRPYVPGDDVRRVDWNLYRRSGRLFLRLYEELEDQPLYVLLDCSASMYFENPPRADAARQFAAALVAISLNQMDRAGIYPCGVDFAPPLEGVMGRVGLRRCLGYLEQLSALGPTNLVRAVRRFAQRPLRPGLLAIVSDFFEPQGAAALVDACAGLRHRLLLAAVTRPTDTRPDLAGELRLIDCETGVAQSLTADSTALAEYRHAYDDHFGQLRRFAAARQARWINLDAEQPVLAQLQALFAGGNLAIS